MQGHLTAPAAAAGPSGIVPSGPPDVGAAFGLLVALMLALALAGVWRRARLWRRGRPAPVGWAGGLLAMPRRYLVDVHHVVGRDPYAARMHMFVAGGLLAGCALAVVGILPGLGGARAWWAVVALAFAAMLGGAVAVGARRYPRRPPRLSGGGFQLLPVLLVGFALAGLACAVLAVLRVPADGAAGIAAVALAAATGLPLAYQTARGPMRHALTGALHLAAHPRPSRFEDGPRGHPTALLPLDLDADRLGVAVPADFGWNRLLSFDACIQCGRCEVACPAFAAGQPLNPKKLIQDLAAAMDPAARAYAGSPYPDARPVAGRGGIDSPIVGEGAMIHPHTLWSCTTCRACVDACPMMIEHVDAVVDLRRHDTLEHGAVPPKAAAALDELRAADDPGGRPAAARGDVFAGQGVRVLGAGEAADVLLWLGASAYDLRAGRTLKALATLLKRAGVDFAILGADERDCGDLARRLGDEATFARLARDNIAALGARRFNRILTADPHALHTLRNEYPAFGGTFEVVHHTAFLAGLVAAGRLEVGTLGESVTYHDPCYLGRYNRETEAPRQLLDALGVARTEMVRHGRRSFCCGGGGGAPLSDIAGDRRIPDIRMDEARATGAKVVAVACPTCTAMLEGVTGARPEVRDVAELVLAAVDARAAVPA